MMGFEHSQGMLTHSTYMMAMNSKWAETKQLKMCSYKRQTLCWRMSIYRP